MVLYPASGTWLNDAWKIQSATKVAASTPLILVTTEAVDREDMTSSEQTISTEHQTSGMKMIHTIDLDLRDWESIFADWYQSVRSTPFERFSEQIGVEDKMAIVGASKNLIQTAEH